MPLWTDIIGPAELTGYARAALEDREQAKGTLAVYLPNREVPSIDVRFVKGNTGLVDTAQFRAYDAEIEIGKGPSMARVTIELPALGQNIPVSEYEQLRAQGAGGNVSDALALRSIQTTTRNVVAAVGDAMERLRGIVLNTGIATIGQTNYAVADDFGRAAGHTTTAGTLWTLAATDRLAYLTTITDLYTTANGTPPGSMLMSTRVARSLAAGTQFQTQLVNGGARPATLGQVTDLLAGAGLPPIHIYDRQVSVAGTATRVIPDNVIILLPAPVGTSDDQGTELGATFWGRTLTATDPDYDLADVDQPGLVTGVYRGEKPPKIAEVIGDAIGLPVLANANLSLAATVL